jgi:hypothetical protein
VREHKRDDENIEQHEWKGDLGQEREKLEIFEDLS